MRQPTRGRRGPPATRPPAPRRLRGVLEIDEGSGHATAHAGTRGPLLEEALNAAGLTLGHFPQSWEFSTLGGWIAKRAAGGLSNRYGRVGELLVGVRLVAPAGTIDLRPLPGEAHGPDLKELVLGSEGTLGVITRATVRAHPLPTARRFASRLFPSFADGLAALRGMAREGSLPDLAYLADEEETRFAAASAGIPPGARPGGGVEWPSLRASPLDQGILVDTVETAAPWSRLPAVYEAGRKALQEGLWSGGDAGIVLCHVSPASPDGASPSYTFLGRAREGAEVAEGERIKGAGTKAL